eukprot:scaffold225243_cov32-Tisochrysis_lutea.AAC.3
MTLAICAPPYLTVAERPRTSTVTLSGLCTLSRAPSLSRDPMASWSTFQAGSRISPTDSKSCAFRSPGRTAGTVRPANAPLYNRFETLVKRASSSVGLPARAMDDSPRSSWTEEDVRHEANKTESSSRIMSSSEPSGSN